jgi:hypothetical protein
MLCLFIYQYNHITISAEINHFTKTIQIQSYYTNNKYPRQIIKDTENGYYKNGYYNADLRNALRNAKLDSDFTTNRIIRIHKEYFMLPNYLYKDLGFMCSFEQKEDIINTFKIAFIQEYGI